MTKLLLGNLDYRQHTTDEGDQLQRGLEHAGWTVLTPDEHECRHVPTLVERYKPSHVLVHDKRDWDPHSRISFRKDIGYEDLGFLSTCRGVRRIAVVKDAGSSPEYHQEFVEEINATDVLTYYHDRSVLACAPWLRGRPLVRTYHTLDSDLFPELPWKGKQERDRGLVSGAVSMTYPLRQRVIAAASQLDLWYQRHPGYGNRGSRTADYLRMLSGYKVHVATASKYGFALRKIIESVACGATPITDLPWYDELPLIDSGIVRVHGDITVEELAQVIDRAEEDWCTVDRRALAACARVRYDYRAEGARLDALLD